LPTSAWGSKIINHGRIFLNSIMKLLLHTCCVPCAVYPIKQAIKDGYNDVILYFFNPNIHPSSEYIKRKKEISKLEKDFSFSVIDDNYNPTSYFEGINGYLEAPGRCFKCWSLRIGNSVSAAKKNNIDAFSTTLLESPYQDHEKLKEICSSACRKNNIDFYYKDFRIGFKDAHSYSKDNGIYCQNYCGCIFSLVEKEEKRKSKRK